MKREDKMKALGIINDWGGTVQTKVVLDTQVKDDYLGIFECPPTTIEQLMDAGYTMSMHEGFLLIDKY